MGSLLSFPLLCLQNYIATTYILGMDRPMLINGDDLLTRCSPWEYREWLERLPALGLVPSVGKCGFLRSFFTINSTYFQLVGRSVRRAPVFRGKGFRQPEYGPPEGSALREHRGCLKGKYRQNFETLYVESHRYTICRAGRSLKALGWDLLPNSVPRWAAVREWTLQGVHERPLPVRPKTHTVGGIPEGWRLRSAKWVADNYPEREPLIRREQAGIWARGKESVRDIAKTLVQDRVTWWTEVTCTGFRPVKLERKKIKWCEGACSLGPRTVHLHESPVVDAFRLKARDIGPTLRALQKKKSEPAEDLLLVPSSWPTKQIKFVSGGIVRV